MKEVEIKARIGNREQLITELEKRGCRLSNPVHQRDRIFVHRSNTEVKSETGRRILRIREQGEKVILTLKVHQSNELESIEKEIEVNDAHLLKEIIELLGFMQTVEVEKYRRKGHFQGYEVCVDTVTGLGDFLEIEALTDQDPAVVQESLWRLAQSLGIERKDQEMRGYDTLVRLKQTAI